mgnify:CR=1 FL=1
MVGIATFFLGIIITNIGFFIQRRFFSKAPKQSFTPAINVSPITQRNRFYAEINNVGNDPLESLSVSIAWLKDGEQQKKAIDRFFNPVQNPITESSHNCTFLDVKEKKIMTGLPNSDDGNITFTVQCRGINSRISINKSFTIQNKQKTSANNK